MRSQTGIRCTALLSALLVLTAATIAPRALADPAADAALPSDPSPGTALFSQATINPSNGSTVGVAKPIVINFAEPITDRATIEDGIHILSDPPVPGQFYWRNDSQVRWRPLDFWPAHTTVTIEAAGITSSFTTGDALIATADDATHQMTITRNGNLEQTFPISMGKPGQRHPAGPTTCRTSSPTS